MKTPSTLSEFVRLFQGIIDTHGDMPVSLCYIDGILERECLPVADVILTQSPVSLVHDPDRNPDYGKKSIVIMY